MKDVQTPFASLVNRLREAGYAVRALTPYQLRVNETLDVYPVHSRYHNVVTGNRGRFYDLDQEFFETQFTKAALLKEKQQANQTENTMNEAPRVSKEQQAGNRLSKLGEEMAEVMSGIDCVEFNASVQRNQGETYKILVYKLVKTGK